MKICHDGVWTIKKRSARDLSWRERRVLDAVKEKRVLCYSDLPYMVGRSAMERLVNRGLVNAASTRVGKHSKDHEWSRK